jgi:small subunit ribosomal protein S1
MDLNTSGLSDTEQIEALPVEPTSDAAAAAADTATEMVHEATTPAMIETAEAAVPPEEIPAPAAEVEVIADAPASDGEAPVHETEAVADAQAAATISDAPTIEGEAAADAPTAEAAPPTRLKRGELVDGKIVSTSPLQIILDLGEGDQGIITSAEIEKMTRQQLEALKPDEVVTVFIVNPQSREGGAIVSINRAIEELDWQKAEEFRQSQDAYDTRIAGYNKGGLIVRFGRLRGFVPSSQLSGDRRRAVEGEGTEERWSKMVNEPITVKVMEVDRGRNRLILSERLASRESREKRKEALVNQLNVGEIRSGRVVSLEDFGAFIDVGGAEGLVHLTELSWQHVTHPRELLRVGQEVTVEVISIDKEHKRIGLSMKRQTNDPWDTIAVTYEVGQLVQGLVTKLTKFGAFVQLVDVPEIEGLVHISELSERRVNTPRDVVQEGDKLTLRVVKIDVRERRLGLSLKKVNSAEYLDRDWAE